MSATHGEDQRCDALLTHVDGPTREAARADHAGFERMLHALPDEHQQRAEYLHGARIVGDGRPSPDVIDGRAAMATQNLSAHVVEECGVAP